METQAQNIWEFLEREDDRAPDAQRLFRWSLNFDHGQRPWELYLDIIGWSEDNYGTNFHKGKYGDTVKCLEADYLGRALMEWALNPYRVEKWVNELMECED